MRYFALTAFLVFIFDCASAQNLIGSRESEIKKYMRENRKDMSLNTVTNSKFIYLKYSDNSDSNTTLFFLNADSVCKSIRIICDDNVKAQMRKDFDSSFKKKDENHWIEVKDGKQYLIEVKDGKWSNDITIEPIK
jgi:hypothetical protein